MYQTCTTQTCTHRLHRFGFNGEFAYVDHSMQALANAIDGRLAGSWSAHKYGFFSSVLELEFWSSLVFIFWNWFNLTISEKSRINIGNRFTEKYKKFTVYLTYCDLELKIEATIGNIIIIFASFQTFSKIYKNRQKLEKLEK